MTAREKHDIITRIAALPPADRIEIVEELLRGLRLGMLDQEAVGRQMDDMAVDPGMQRVMGGHDLRALDAAG